MWRSPGGICGNQSRRTGRARLGKPMTASSKRMTGEAEKRYPARIKVAVPLGGFGQQLNHMHLWLDENAGADGWAIAPAGLRGVVNDAVAIYFLDAAVASA